MSPPIYTPTPDPRRSSLEVVEQDAATRSFGNADAIPALVVQIVLVDRQAGPVWLAP